MNLKEFDGIPQWLTGEQPSEQLVEDIPAWLKGAGKSAGNAVKGVTGAIAANSDTVKKYAPGVAAAGQNALNTAAIKRSQSTKGQRIKRQKMTQKFVNTWSAESNKILKDTGADPTLEEFNKWVDGFMGGRPVEPYNGKMKPRAIKKYLAGLVNEFVGSADPNTSKPQAPTQAKPAAPSGKFKRDKQSSMRSKPIQNSSLQRSLMVSYLFEAAGKNVHMEHVEDLVFNSGFEGAKAAVTYIEQVISMLSKGAGTKATITTKWDGAPAIVCGIDPTDGKFFVGTKSVFGKMEPKIVKTVANANNWYREKQPDLADKLILCLKQLPKLGISGVLQGDLMFDNVSSQLETANIDGESMLTFGPNTITYAVPAKSDLATTMKRAKLGIVFHTVYEGADMQSMEASFGFNAGSLKQTPDVWADDATYTDLTGTASLTPEEVSKFSNLVKATKATMAKIRPEKFNVVIEDSEFKKYIKPYINKLVREDKTVGNITEFLNDFFEFYRGKIQKEIDKLADPEGRAGQSRVLKIKKQEEFLEDNMNHIAGVLAVFKRLTEIKLLLIQKLHQVEGMGTFVKDGDGYEVTNPEGFVAIGHDGGAVKLVDRLEFSKQNFNAVKQWDKK